MVKRCLVAGSAAALASLGVIIGGPAAHGVVNVCADVKGTQRVQSGSATCLTLPDTSNNAVAVGPNSFAGAGGSKNTAVAVGSTDIADAGPGTRNTSASVGSNNRVSAFDGDNNTATAVGSHITAFAGSAGTHHTAVSAQDSCSVFALGVDHRAICP